MTDVSVNGLYLDRVKDSLKHGKNITEEKVPSLGQRIQ